MIRNREAIATTAERDVALACLEAGIEAADPATVVPDHVALDGDELVVAGDRYDLDDYDRVLVLGGGKAAAVVAAALEGILGDRIDGGVVVTNAPVATERVAVRSGAHPVPATENVEATAEVVERAEDAGREDLVLGVLTGGGSALLAAPAEGISLTDLQDVTASLLEAGASIRELNAVRKHCSAIKGGRLADALAPATVAGLAVSDVVGDDLDVIASGPLSPDESTYDDALAVLDGHGIDAPPSVLDRLERGSSGAITETPAEESRFGHVRVTVVADGTTAIDGAAEVARERGYDVCSLGAGIRGEARAVGRTIAGIAAGVATAGEPAEPPAVLLSGGEATVTVRGDGAGGPNQEFVLAAALELATRSVPGAAPTVASVDTDGIDGASDAAGGIATPETVRDADAAREALARNDAGGFLADADATIDTGPTRTNVNDLRVVLVPDGH